MGSFSGIFLFNREMQIESFNFAAEKIFGYTESEVLGKNIKTLFSIPNPKDLDQYVNNCLLSVKSGAMIENIEGVGARKDGTSFSLEFSIQQVDLNQKKVLIGIVRDLSRDKDQKNDPENIINLNQLILDSAGEGIYGIDIEGNISFVNPAAELLLGYRVEELIGQSHHSMIHHSKPDGTSFSTDECHLCAAIKIGKIHRESTEVFWRKDGANFPVEYVSTPIQKDGKLEGAVVIFSDNTDLKLSEAKFVMAIRKVSQAREEAEIAKAAANEANQAKSNFLANMSHEIRTPLNAVLGYAQILQRNTSMDPKQKKAVKAIETSGTHLLELINDILDISKIEVGQVKLNPTDFDLYDLLKGLGVIFKVQAESKKLNFRIEGLDQKPVFVRGDEGKIRQILVNLLGNAVKFTDHGEVVLQLENNKKNQFKFSVRDTGNGIPPEVQSHIFEPFKQAEEGLNKGGTGLGLAISHELTEIMGGQLSLDSSVGKGSCFFFTLELGPAVKPVLSRSTRSRRVKKLSRKSRVKALVVDDMEVNRDMLADVLLSIGVETMQAVNGKEAVEQVGVFEPDIIFMDMRMPVMNGEKAIREIFKQYGEGRYKIVAVTASSLSHEKEKSISLGCVDHIGKPFRIAQIYDCIQNILGVEYEYEENQEAVEEETPSQIVELSEIRIPAKMFLNFKDALETKNKTQLEKELAILCQLDNGSYLKDQLDPLFESNDYDGMMDILEQVLVVGVLHD